MSSGLFSALVLRSGEHAAQPGREGGDGGGDGWRCAAPGRAAWSSLYRRWVHGGAGLLITGNVMVHAEALTGPGGIVLDDRAA